MTDTLKMLADDWRNWLFDHALPLWSEAGVIAGGGFEDSIGWDRRPTASPLRARVQARQIYVFSTAGALGWDGPWRTLVHTAQDFIQRAFRRSDGLYRTLVARDGSTLDDTAMLYDQAFFLFAGASAAAADPERADALEGSALAHLDRVESHFAHPAGGFWEASDGRPFQSNPHMHLFEAALAWEAQSGHPRWAGVADRIAELCLSRFINPQSGGLREFFAADWSPAPGAPGRMVEPGHQFEWAWLLSRWSGLRDHAPARAAAERLFEIGATHGVDPRRGVAVNALDDKLALLDPAARLWPQTEWIKAALRLAREDREAQIAAASAGLKLYTDVTPKGLWRDRLREDGSFVEEPAPASSFYHIVCALAELFTAAKD